MIYQNLVTFILSKFLSENKLELGRKEKANHVLHFCSVYSTVDSCSLNQLAPDTCLVWLLCFIDTGTYISTLKQIILPFQ